MHDSHPMKYFPRDAATSEVNCLALMVAIDFNGFLTKTVFPQRVFKSIDSYLQSVVSSDSVVILVLCYCTTSTVPSFSLAGFM